MAEAWRALTVRQPWAWAMVMGYKDVENRSRPTSHRGQLLIHAGRQLDPLGFQQLWELGLHRNLPTALPRGGLIGSIEVVDCIDNADSNWAENGFWHWILRRPVTFKSVLECRGAQGIFMPDVSNRSIGQALRHSVRHPRRPRR